MGEDNPSSGVALTDPTDGRRRHDWKSKYPDEAKKEIRIEVACVLGTFF